MRRPSASVLVTSMVLPLIAVITSLGFSALLLGMFSVAGTTASTSPGTSISAIRPMAAMTAAPPAMSIFISSIPAEGLMEIPPLSKVTPLPTRPSTSRPFFTPFGGR